MAERQVTVKGLRKEQAELKETFDKARASFDKAQSEYKKAKVELVEFQNSYGRVLEVLEKPVPVAAKAPKE